MQVDLSIEQIVERCMQGDRKAQEQLYRLFSAKMLGVCMRYGASRFEAEDLLQMGFLKMYSALHTYRGNGSFEGWLRRIMVNVAIENFHKNQRVHTWEIAESDRVTQQNEASADLEINDLLTLIRKMPEGYRLVFNMYAVEGYSHKEIAGALKISESASKSQLSRGRKWLKERLKKETIA